ncbi:putative Histidine kinase [Desulfamplus magnetovallimortis]|uniref:histidine kinase n=1 Tax=Desulfamplus magnetovallimortis TaxID=1246637 RepID=A0A1W1HCI3_9BACT|nr:response regulator [Desulfamplus magnetovallimortis]SLM30153.1 putative Histidine kinase [Desulfamplus magnetovallimortis]
MNKILLVDDEPIILNAIAVLLKQKGYSITTASSGEEALEIIQHQTFDLVVTDLVMDKIDGLTLLKKIKHTFNETMVMLLTGHGELSCAVDAMRLGADDFLVKPAEPSILCARVAKCLEKLETLKLAAKTEQAVHNMEKIFHKFEALSTMAGGIAHQFNNALAEILGNIELLKMDYSGEEKLLLRSGKIKKSIEKMTRLTTQLLTYARGGKHRNSPISLTDFLKKQQQNILNDPEKQNECNTVFNICEEELSVNLDKVQLEMLFSAIYSNACEALKDNGKITITLDTHRVSISNILNHPGLKPGAHASLKISDNGTGMNEETRHRVMEPFFSTKFQGRGMGMAAAFGIVKHHKGWINIESEPDKGTTVTTFFPLAITDDEQKSLQSLEHGDPQRRKGTILVIEDEKMVMDVNFAILDILGYHVLSAGTATEAIHIAENYHGQIDIILLDLILPDMPAKKLLPLLKNEKPNARIIICSGYALNGEAQGYLEQGADAYIKKPFSIAKISEVLAWKPH